MDAHGYGVFIHKDEADLLVMVMIKCNLTHPMQQK